MVQKEVKLNLGCFNKPLHGFINIDIRPPPETAADLVEDIFSLPSFQPNSVDLIYSAHTLEHGTRDQAMMALLRWKEILKPGGLLRLAVPDLEAAFKHYIFHEDLRVLYTTLFGSQKHSYDFHLTGWDEKTLTQDLLSAGFVNPRRYDWTQTEHWYCDDYSSVYMPSHTREYSNGKVFVKEGRLMSLNMEANKPT